MNQPADIIFVRYCPGAAGNFIISLIQLHPGVAHWDINIERHRAQMQDHDLRAWFHDHFNSDLANHLKHEPHHPYQLDFVSSKYPRGDDISWPEFLQLSHERNDLALAQAMAQRRPVVLRLHKSRIPDWAVAPRIINVIADPASHRWLHRTRLTKLFGFDGTHWISRENDPDFLRHKFRHIQFQNTYRFQRSAFGFIREHVIREPVVDLFKSPDRLLAHDSNRLVPQQFMLNLSSLFDHASFQQMVSDLYTYLELGQPNLDLATQFYQHYWRTNIEPVLSRCRHT